MQTLVQKYIPTKEKQTRKADKNKLPNPHELLMPATSALHIIGTSQYSGEFQNQEHVWHFCGI